MQLTGAQALIKSLEIQGVEVMFGLPGGAILPVYDPILDSSIRHILVRHEQGAGHMAEGYAMVTGRPGVAMVTSGRARPTSSPRSSNAYMDSTPLVVISGQVADRVHRDRRLPGVRHHRGDHGHHQAQLAHQGGRGHPRVVAAAFHVATTGRPGPVLIDVPKDVSNATMEWYWPERRATSTCPGTTRSPRATRRTVREAAELIAAAERPVHLRRRRDPEVPGRRPPCGQLAERTGIPVVTTLMARGAFPDSHPLCLGMPGMHGNYTAVTAMQRADLLVALGSRFDDRVTGRVDAFAPEAKVIHVDIDPAELGKVRRPEVADRRRLPAGHRGARSALAAGDSTPRASTPAATGLGRGGDQLALGWQERFPLHYDDRRDGDALKPQMVMETLRDPSPDGHDRGGRGRPAPDVGLASTGGSTTPTPGSTRAARAPWASPCPRPSGPRWDGPTGRCGRSTGTAASR